MCVSASYEASIKKMETTPQVNIFESNVKWNNFKKKHFSELSAEAHHFLEPWIKELDRIVKKIENL